VEESPTQCGREVGARRGGHRDVREEEPRACGKECVERREGEVLVSERERERARGVSCRS
jgi:hypothetical protein